MCFIILTAVGVRRANLAYMQGWRKTQEDAHTVCMDIKELPGCSFAAVFDGHGGPQVSRFR